MMLSRRRPRIGKSTHFGVGVAIGVHPYFCVHAETAPRRRGTIRRSSTFGKAVIRTKETGVTQRALDTSISRRTVVKASLAAPAVAALPISLRGVAAQDKKVATMVTDTLGLGDQNFNDLANKGGTEAAAAFGLEWKVIESEDAAAYSPNLIAAAEQSDLTVAVGYLLQPDLEATAQQFPDDMFLYIDGSTELPNIRGVTFKEQEGGYLAGLVAGLMTQTGKVGIVGGERIPPVIRYEVGFVAGVKTTNPDAEIAIAYADTFSDPGLGKQLAEAMLQDGVDIILPIAGGSSQGCYEAIKAKGAGFWAISADTTQARQAPGQELCVAQKGVDFSVYQGCQMIAEGNFEPGNVNLGIAEGGVSLQDPEGNVPEGVMALVMAMQEQIIAGSVVPPADDDALKAFQAPALPEATPAA
jgi:basic membrane protein A